MQAGIGPKAADHCRRSHMRSDRMNYRGPCVSPHTRCSARLAIVTTSQPTSDPMRRPLVVRFGSMGDMVIALTLIRALHQRFCEPVDVISSGSWTRPLLEGQVGVGNLYLIRSRRMPYPLSPRQWQLVRTLRARGMSPTWVCDSDDKSRWLVSRAGTADSHIIDVRDLTRLPREHAVDRWIRFAQSSPPCIADLCSGAIEASTWNVPPLHVHEQWRKDLTAWLHDRRLTGRPLVLIHAGNRRTTKLARPRNRPSNTKYWPEERWASVVDSIARSNPEAEILLTGVARESRLNQAILYLSATNRARDVAQDLTVHRLLALQERAIGMISVDTGPAHAAAALGCPLVVLFGTSDPEQYAPRSATNSVVCLRGYELGRPSMLGISVKEVVDAWNTLRNSETCRRALDVIG